LLGGGSGGGGRGGCRNKAGGWSDVISCCLGGEISETDFLLLGKVRSQIFVGLFVVSFDVVPRTSLDGVGADAGLSQCDKGEFHGGVIRDSITSVGRNLSYGLDACPYRLAKSSSGFQASLTRRLASYD
jgi:hypothetical protein